MQISETYWNKRGKYQQDYDRLFAELVPEEGNANTIEGELLRAASRIGYRFYNDGDMCCQGGSSPAYAPLMFLEAMVPKLSLPIADVLSTLHTTKPNVHAEGIEVLINRIVEHILSQKEMHPNDENLDFFNWADDSAEEEYEQLSCYEDDDEDYEEEDYEDEDEDDGLSCYDDEDYVDDQDPFDTGRHDVDYNED